MLSKIFRKKRKKKATPQYKLKWEKKWSSGDFDASWEADDIPVLIRDMEAKGIIKKGASLIDVGCGSGKLSFLLAEEGFDVLGIDFSESAIKQAKTNYGGKNDRLNFQVHDITNEPPEDWKFDLAVDKGTFHVIPLNLTPKYAMNIHKILSDNGRIILAYALKKAWKLREVKKNYDIKNILKQHIEDIFSQYFTIEEYANSSFKRHFGFKEPALLILMKKKQFIK